MLLSRKSFHRALALVAGVPALTAGLLAAAPAAHAATMPTCPAIGSSVLTEFDAFELGHTRIATYQASPTTTVLCVQTLTGYTANIVLKGDFSFSVPSISNTTGTGGCGTDIIKMTAPTALWLSIDWNTSPVTLCIGKDNVTTRITLVGVGGINTIPDVEVWFPAYSGFLTWGSCAVQYLNYEITPSSANYNAWVNCYSYDRQVI